MGVMECSRRCCDNILCERYSSQYGYLCDECFNELVDSGFNTDIAAFMQSTSKRNYGDKDLIYEKYNRIFEGRNK